ncbi:hypothetical protein LDENG_00077330 [Lucifuga dentata]|nr:hypothetical protein LDENG_00077330 [Lucifuga dentata]
MSGGSSTNNNWTILTPEETATETLRPLAEGTEHHEESRTSAAEQTDCGADSRVAEGAASAAEGVPVEDHLVSEGKTAHLSDETVADLVDSHTFITSISDALPSSSDVHGSDALSQSEGLPEGPAHPSPEEPPASLLSTETLRGVELTQEERLHPLNGEEVQQEGEESELSPGMTALGKQADFPVGSEVKEEETGNTGEEEESEGRRRRSLLTNLERIGRKEEEEEGEEEFQLPPREEDSGLSLNKCILGAVILLGIGTIFFSGVFMDLDEESDYGTGELKDSEVPVKQEWLNPEVPPPPGDVENTELLNKLAKENQLIAVLQAQLQAQKEELKVAKGQAAEGAKERLQWEEVEKENSRLKKEMASLPVLQKENERMKRLLESVPALQKELERLRATVAELKHSRANEAAPASESPTASPSSGQPEDNMQGTAEVREKHARKPWNEQKVEKKKAWKKEKYDMGEQKEWKERDAFDWKEGEKKERKDGSKTEWNEWKKEKHEQGRHDKENHDKEWKWKDERKEQGKNDWKSKNGKDHGKAWKEKDERRGWSDEGEWKGEGSKEKKHNGDWKKDRRSFHEHKDEHKSNENQHHRDHHHHHDGHLWQGPADRKPPHTQRRPPLEHPDYWVQQKDRLQHDSRPPHQCNSVAGCAQAEGLLPVPLSEFETILQGYLTKAEELGVDAYKRDELSKLTAEFFKNGVFVHDQMSFRDFVEDVGDILEDMVEGDEDEDAEDDAIEEEMDGFEREVIKKFSVPEAGEKEERMKEDRGKESGRGRG